MWKDDFSIIVVHSNHHLILAHGVRTASNQNFNLVCIYEDPHHLKTNDIWGNVSAFVLENPNTPTFCMGDLNNIMHINEKSGPNPANVAQIRNFCCLVKDCGFFDLCFNGPSYTWTNKRLSTNPTFQRLDRRLANAEWCTAFPAMAIFNLPMIYSDHAPILAILHSILSVNPNDNSVLKIGGSWNLITTKLQTAAGQNLMLFLFTNAQPTWPKISMCGVGSKNPSMSS